MDGTKHYLITGGAGFVGSHLAEALLGSGQRVTVIDDLSTGRFENISHLVDRYGRSGEGLFSFSIDTITNETVLDRLASESDVILHMAAAVGVRLIVENPVRTIETNIMGTEALLRTALRYRSKVLLASTSEVYGKGNSIPFRESDDVVLGPTTRRRWSYAASKMVDEFLGLAYHEEKGLPVTIFRLFNTVGPRQTGRYGMVVPRFIRQALQGEPLTVYGDGAQSRCFLHVKDAVEAILALEASEAAIGGVFNVGSEEEVTIRELAENVLRQVAGRPPDDESIRLVPYDQAYDVGFEDMLRRVPDTSKVRELLGWSPKRRLDDILRDTLASMQSADRSGSESGASRVPNVTRERTS